MGDAATNQQKRQAFKTDPGQVHREGPMAGSASVATPGRLWCPIAGRPESSGIRANLLVWTGIRRQGISFNSDEARLPACQADSPPSSLRVAPC